MQYVSRSEILCHPDKLELFLMDKGCTSQVLQDSYPELIRAWTDRWQLRWRHEQNQHQWKINGWNEQIRVTFSGPGQDIAGNSEWRTNPFRDIRSHPWDLYNRRSWLAIVRITDAMKIHPDQYCAHLSEILADLEKYGIQEKPRVIEIALDCYDIGLAKKLQRTVRLQRDFPGDLCHYRDGQYQPGGSPDGTHTEYSMRGIFPPRGAQPTTNGIRPRQLVCYWRPDQQFYRVELRLGYRFLDKFYLSGPYERAIECHTVPNLVRDYDLKVASPTLDLIGFIPYFVRTQLAFECLDLPYLYRSRNSAKFLALKGHTARQQRYQLSGKRLKAKWTTMPTPPIRYILPRQVRFDT